MNNRLDFSSTDEAYKYLITKAAGRGISQGQLARDIGIEKQNITNTLRRGNVKVSSLKQMADVLGITVEVSLISLT